MKKLILICTIVLMANGIQAQWRISGNVGTTNSNFLGTLDQMPLSIRTNDELKIHITAGDKIGFFTELPQANLHLHHTASLINPLTLPIFDTIRPDDKGGDSQTNNNTFLFTNDLTGGTLSDGFIITQASRQITLKQQENSPFRLFAMNNRGLIIAPNGNVTIGSHADYNLQSPCQLYVSGTSYADKVTGKMVDVKHSSTGDWNYAVRINVDRDLTRAIAVLHPQNGEVFRVYGNGITFSKYLVTTQIKVDLNATDIHWYDHVFAPEYELMPLKDVEKFVRENHHLPDIPSETYIRQNGLNLAEMDGLLLKKIEEMTLYIIELEKRLSDLETH